MSNIFWIILGALLMSTIDYLMFYFGLVNTENHGTGLKNEQGFKKLVYFLVCF